MRQRWAAFAEQVAQTSTASPYSPDAFATPRRARSQFVTRSDKFSEIKSSVQCFLQFNRQPSIENNRQKGLA
jgi:hypothetical protein